MGLKCVTLVPVCHLTDKQMSKMTQFYILTHFDVFCVEAVNVGLSLTDHTFKITFYEATSRKMSLSTINRLALLDFRGLLYAKQFCDRCYAQLLCFDLTA